MDLKSDDSILQKDLRYIINTAAKCAGKSGERWDFQLGFPLRGSSEAGGRGKLLQTPVRRKLGAHGVDGHRAVGQDWFKESTVQILIHLVLFLESVLFFKIPKPKL